MSILNCTLCGNCLICPYLKKYGYPKELFFKRDSSVFICSNCGLCSWVCPYLARPAETLYSLKEDLIKEGRLEGETLKAIKSSREFVKSMSAFPFSHIDFKEVLFFPGCALVSMGVDIVYKLKKLIEERLKIKVGLLLHCCGDPLYQNGDLLFLDSFLRNFKEKLENCGVDKIIFGCANCKKIFEKYLQGIDKIHLVELFGEDDLKKVGNPLVIHHPCPNFLDQKVRDRINKIFHKYTEKIFQEPSCCGLGGSANKLDQEVSKNFLERVKKGAEEKEIVTSCMGCKNRFLKNGISGKHIIEYLTGQFIDKPLSDTQKWINRLKISLISKLNLTKIFLLLLIIIGVFYVYSLKKEGLLNIEGVFNYVKSYKYLSPIIYILIYSIGPSIFFPSLILTLIAGMIWGPFWGVIFAISGATIGCSVPFFLSRYLFYNLVKRTFGVKRWEKLSNLVKDRGWKIVAFTRIVPLFPFPVLNYLYGITPIPFLHYVVASFVFMLPACIAYVYLGSSLFDLIAKGEILGFAIAIILISLIMFIPYLIKRLTQKN